MRRELDPCRHPLGPLLCRSRLDESASVRRRAGLALIGCGVLLSTAVAMQPSQHGYEPHEQLGIYRCSWPIHLGIPCPTCGMTTAFALTVRGRWLSALAAQPFGFLLAAATLLLLGASCCELVTGRGYRINWYRISPLGVTLTVVGFAGAAWVYKILVTRAQMK